jgi:predicted dithiol-disulfide oxidoreductase (DUF899 family)
VFRQGPCDASVRYREFTGRDVPWCSARRKPRPKLCWPGALSGSEQPTNIDHGREAEMSTETTTPEAGRAEMDLPPIVSAEDWGSARQELLVKEKALTRARDALAAERRRMPRMAVEKDYRFEGPNGPAGLLDLFEGRRQLVVYRFFFEPGVAGWPESGCPGCSLMADQVAHLGHLNSRDTTLAYVSRAPQAEIERWRARMAWDIPWYTITDDFDADFGVDDWHGTNVFLHADDRIFRTYFVDNRGDEALGSTWAYLDITALGRQETWEDSPEGYPQTQPYAWWSLHDEYDRPTTDDQTLSSSTASQDGSETRAPEDGADPSQGG